MLTKRIPWPLSTDAYQASHFLQIPKGMEDYQVAQVIHRKPLFKDDYRLVHAGVQLFVEMCLSEPMTLDDIWEAEKIYKDFYIGKPYPFPKQMFERTVREFGGYPPITIFSLRDGSAHYVGEPCVQVVCNTPGMGEWVGYIESTMLPYIWASTIVATRGRKRKEKMEAWFKKHYPSKSADEISAMVAYKFHDFGDRGAASSDVTGVAHLMNWLGTDTMRAVYIAQNWLNHGKSFGACSIPAAAHRTITPHATEDAAYEQIINEFKGGVFAIVADSYNYVEGMKKLARYAKVIKTSGGFIVGRPDSGDPVQCVIQGLEIFGEAFGTTNQEMGYKVINGAAIIQGDGVDDDKIFDEIYPRMQAKGWCPSNVAFGMGENNHKAVRSEIETAYKICSVRTPEGEIRPVMKWSESPFKRSLPCPVGIDVLVKGGARIKPVHSGSAIYGYSPIYSCRPWDSYGFEAIRKITEHSWKQLAAVPDFDVIPQEIRDMQVEYMKTH